MRLIASFVNDYYCIRVITNNSYVKYPLQGKIEYSFSRRTNNRKEITYEFTQDKEHGNYFLFSATKILIPIEGCTLTHEYIQSYKDYSKDTYFGILQLGKKALVKEIDVREKTYHYLTYIDGEEVDFSTKEEILNKGFIIPKTTKCKAFYGNKIPEHTPFLDEYLKTIKKK